MLDAAIFPLVLGGSKGVSGTRSAIFAGCEITSLAELRVMYKNGLVSFE